MCVIETVYCFSFHLRFGNLDYINMKLVMLDLKKKCIDLCIFIETIARSKMFHKKYIIY